MAGYGNRTAPDPSFDGHETKYGLHTDTSSYQGGHPERKSGTVGGAGFGNKSAVDPQPADTSDFDFSKTNSHTEPYSGGHPEHKSGTVGGAGLGNKTGSFGEDSRLGMIQQKLGGILKNEKMQEAGLEKRKSAGYSEGESVTA